MGQDLRSYLDLIKQNHPEDFLVVSRAVDPAYEITAITVKLEQEAKRLGGQKFKALNRAGFAHPPTLFRTILSGEPYPVKGLIVTARRPA